MADGKRGEGARALRLSSVKKSYGAVEAIAGVDLEVLAGEFLVLLGPSGCGKSTLLRCICGLEDVSGGTVSVGDRLVTDYAQGLNVPPNHRGMGMVFQNYSLWPHMSVRKNVEFPLKSRGRRSSDTEGEVLALLERVRCEHLAERFPSELSGGQQQRIALARSLAGRPDVVLFDEPLSNIDVQLRRELRREIRDLHGQLGFTAVYVTHDQTEAFELADRVAVMDSGLLRMVGSPEEIYDNPVSAAVAQFLDVGNCIGVLFANGVVVDGVAQFSGEWSRLLGAGNSPVDVYVRPTDVHWTDGDVTTGSTNGDILVCGGGIVRDAVFTGRDTEYVVTLEGGSSMRMRRPRSEGSLEIGASVSLYFGVDDVLVFSHNDGARMVVAEAYASAD